MQAVREIYREQCSSNEPHGGGGVMGDTPAALSDASPRFLSGADCCFASRR